MVSDVRYPLSPKSRREGARIEVGPRPAPSAQFPHEPPGRELKSLVAKVWRRRWTVLVGLVPVMAAVATFTYLQPKIYRSSALVLVEGQSRPSDVPALAALQSLAGDQIETEIELIKSRNVMESVVDQLDLHVLVELPDGVRRPREVFPDFSAGPGTRPGEYAVRFDPEFGYRVVDPEVDTLIATGNAELALAFGGLSGTIPPEVLQDGFVIRNARFGAAVRGAQSQLTVSRVNGDADLINISCEGLAPRAAHALCDATLRNYIQLRTNLQRAEATAEAEFLRGQVARLGEQLTAAEDSLEAYGRRNQVVALEQRANQEVALLIQTRAQRDQLEAERSALSALIREIEAQNGGTRKYRDLASFPTFLQNLSVRQLLASVTELEDRRADLVLRRSEQNADVVAIDDRISELEDEVRSIAVSYEHSLATQIQSLDSTLAQTNRSLATLPTQQVQTARLERQAESLEELYRLLETRLREAEVAEAVDLPSVRVVDAASMPLGPASPNPKLNLTMGLVLGMGLGVMLALYRDDADTRIRERREVERETGLPVLTMIPRIKGGGALVNYALPKVQASGNSRRILVTKPSKPETNHVKEPRWKRDRAITEFTIEAIRTLAADLSFIGADRGSGSGSAHCVAITSAGRDEGKTFTSCNLALLRAAHGAKTLLIDADLRAGGVSEFFQFSPNRPGLTDVLSGNAEIGEVSQELQVGNSKLWVIPAGTPTQDATRLLESESFGRLLERASAKFDLVLVDTPPLSLIADAATIANVVHSVVVVVRGGRTDRDALEITLDRLARAGGNVVGVVLNEAAVSGGYYNRYGYGYGYGSSSRS